MFKFARGAANTILFKKPINARLWLTYRCNYKCTMCSIHKVKNPKELSLWEIAVVAQNLKKIGVSQVILTGGEALLRKDIVEIIKIFKPYGFIIRIQTNAGRHVTESLIDQCYNAGLNDISISLDTLDFLKQDEICGANEVAENALRILKYCIKRYSQRGFIGADIVVSRKNFLELPKVVEYADKLGAFINPCIFVRNFASSSHRGEEKEYAEFSLLGFDHKEIDKTIDKVKAQMKKGCKILMSERILEDMRHYMKTGKYHWACMGGILSFDMLPTGEMVPCCDTTDIACQAPVANLKNADFLTVYKSNGFKEKLKTRRHDCPGCLYACYRDPKYLAYDFNVQWEAFVKSIKFGKFFK